MGIKTLAVVSMFISAIFAGTASAVPAAYLLGPGDNVSIWALGADEIGARPFRVDLNGYIDVPMAGQIRAAGLTADQLRAEIVKQLSAQIKNPQVTVSVTDVQSQPVSVMGAVNKPGVYQLEGEKTLLEVLSMAQGVTNDAGNSVRISRALSEGPLPMPGASKDASGRFTVAETGLRDALDSRDPVSALIMKPHDVINVSQGQMVYVIGDVQKPGGFALGQREKISVLEALSLAAGPSATAKPSAAVIVRESPDGSNRKDIPVNIARILHGKASDVQLRGADILYVPDNSTKNVALRAAEAAVSIGTGVAIWRIP